MDFYTPTGNYYARRGYVVVWQNVRGTFASQGQFNPWKDDAWGEHQDGYDTIEWAAQQTWSNGKVGMLGASYSGLTQYLAAPTRPPHLKALFVQTGWGSIYNQLFRGGAHMLAVRSWLPMGMVLQHLQDESAPEGMENHRTRLEQALTNLDSWLRHLPVKSIPPMDGLADWYFDLIDHPAYSPYWWSTDLATKYSEVDVPIMHWNGWFDFRLDATLDSFHGIRQHGQSELCRNGQRLVIGPWGHTGLVNGEMDFGPDAAYEDYLSRLRWYDYWLKEMENGLMDESPVRLFLMGVNRWVEFQNWPPNQTRYQPLFFRQGTGVNKNSLNNGRLTFQAPDLNMAADSFSYDPRDPIPSMRTMEDHSAKNFQPIEGKMLTYTSDILEDDLTLIGPVKATLYGSSTAADTDWVVRLCDVWPDGRSIWVCDGILRARYWNSLEKEELLVPDQVYQFEVDLWATAQVFQAGHRLRVHVTSNDYPWYDRNLNTGGPFGEEVKGVVAVNRVFHDAMRASHLLLPVISRI